MDDLLILQRQPLTGKATTGRFFMQRMGVTRPTDIYSLELPWRNNEPRVSCVPDGIYPMIWANSPRLKKKTWRLQQVPDRDGILIHPANFVNQLLGCIAPGLAFEDLNDDGVIDITSSGVALMQLEKILLPYIKTGIDIDIRNAA